jgi:FixJ family two-component response regulator
MLADTATVLLVDDDPAVRRGVSRLLRAAGFGVKTFASPRSFLSFALPAGPACVLLDLCMEELSGLEVQDVLRGNGRRLPVVFLSGRGTIPDVAAGFKGGADDFLEKPVPPKKLVATVYRAIGHDRSQLADLAAGAEDRRRYDRLTPREREVMGEVTSGQLNKQSAADLGISEKTIKVHRARVMEKMEVESLAALVRVAGRLGVPVAARTGGDASSALPPPR